MKNMSLFLICLILINTAFAGLPPTTLRGLQQSSKTTTFNFEVPNNQSTKTSTGTLVESGSDNLLVNPSFEHSTYDTGWTVSGTKAVETSAVIDGKQSLKITASGSNFSVVQSSSLYSAQFTDGVQGLAMVRVKTSMSGIQLCAVLAGGTSSTLCVSHSGSGKWELLKVPFILGGTSNGLSIASNSSPTGIVYIDDAFLGAVDLKVDGTQVNSQWNYIVSGSAVTGNATITSAFSDSSGSGLYTYSAGIYTALKKIEVKASLSVTASSTVGIEPLIYLNTTALGLSDGPPTATNGYAMSTAANFIALPGYTWKFVSGGGNSSSHRITVTALDVSSNQTYSASNSDTDWESCGHVAGDFQGFGTPTALDTMCKRDGGDLLMKGRFTTGTTSAVEARVALKFRGVSLTSKSNFQNGQAGPPIIRSNADTYATVVLIQPSTSYITFGRQDGSTQGFATIFGNAVSAASPVTIGLPIVRVPISGWDNSNMIIGSFNEVSTVPGMSKPKKCISHFGGAGTLLAQTVCSSNPCTEYYDNCGTASTSWSATGNTVTTWTAGTWAPNSPLICGAMSGNGVNSLYNNFAGTPVSDASGGLTLQEITFITSGAAANARKAVWCEGQAP